ncbi:MAG TPA: helix-turn-helix transcriptional regulator, partial [bacterium]|nr:helix-turn-helix transcriptional regulator [bacterium]
MDAYGEDARVAGVAAAMGEPARVRMLLWLMDGRARTATELALAAEVTPSTASVHLARMRKSGLVTVVAQGRHRYVRLAGPLVARALEALGVLAHAPASGLFHALTPGTPHELLAARTCYDHAAGRLGVELYDALLGRRWLVRAPRGDLELSAQGERGIADAGVKLDALRGARRRFAFPCLDWSERRPHLGGALGAVLLGALLDRGWVLREPDSRALIVTARGAREMERWLGI